MGFSKKLQLFKIFYPPAVIIYCLLKNTFACYDTFGNLCYWSNKRIGRIAKKFKMAATFSHSLIIISISTGSLKDESSGFEEAEFKQPFTAQFVISIFKSTTTQPSREPSRLTIPRECLRGLVATSVCVSVSFRSFRAKIPYCLLCNIFAVTYKNYEISK